MVNFTLSIPEDLKKEMDKYPDVNWSELTRKSILNYIQNRDKTFPPIEFQLKEVHFAYAEDLMQPLMTVILKVSKKSSETQLIIDRMLVTVKFLTEHFVPHGEECKVIMAKEKEALKGVFKENLLDYRYIIKDVYDDFQITLAPPSDLLRRLSDKIQATFWIDIAIGVFIQGFEYSTTQNLSIKVPIDEWKKQVTSILNNYDADWKSSQ